MTDLTQKISSKYFAYLLLGMDFVFAIASIFRHRFNFGLDVVLLSITRDDGYAENFQYLKLAAIIGLLCFCALSERSAAIGGWAAVFAILLVDDRLAIHERVGAKIADVLSFQPTFHLRAIDFGEMIMFAIWGILAIAILTVTYRKNRSAIASHIFKGLMLSLVGLAIFGGFFDMLDIIFKDIFGATTLTDNIFDILEDGGEMVVVSLALAFIYQKALEVVSKRKTETHRPESLEAYK